MMVEQEIQEPHSMLEQAVVEQVKLDKILNLMVQVEEVEQDHRIQLVEQVYLMQVVAAQVGDQQEVQVLEEQVEQLLLVVQVDEDKVVEGFQQYVQQQELPIEVVVEVVAFTHVVLEKMVDQESLF
jgi:hypothetical protein